MLGGRRATAHLARLGRRRIVFLGETDPEALQRRAGYLKALEEAGIEADEALIMPVDFELESAEAAVNTLVRRGVPFDGIFASSDLIALGAMRALRRAEIRVPEDVSVVGYDDMLLARLSTPRAQHDQSRIPTRPAAARLARARRARRPPAPAPCRPT